MVLSFVCSAVVVSLVCSTVVFGPALVVIRFVCYIELDFSTGCSVVVVFSYTQEVFCFACSAWSVTLWWSSALSWLPTPPALPCLQVLHHHVGLALCPSLSSAFSPPPSRGRHTLHGFSHYTDCHVTPDSISHNTLHLFPSGTLYKLNTSYHPLLSIVSTYCLSNDTLQSLFLFILV